MGFNNLRDAIDSPDTRDALKKVISFLEALCDKQEDEGAFYDYFHELLYNLFGYERKKCWMNEAKGDTEIANLIYSLLAPNGPLFRAIFLYAYQSYEFPKNKLPIGTQYVLETGDISKLSRFYIPKIQSALTMKWSSDYIHINMFEYFFFCFAYYILEHKRSSSSDSSGSKSKASLKSFFRNIGSPLSNNNKTQQNVDVTFDLLATYLQWLLPKEPTNNITKKMIAEYADVFLQIVIDFWLNQIRPIHHEYLTSSYPAQFNPKFQSNPISVTEAVNMLVKYLTSHPNLHHHLKQLDSSSEQSTSISAPYLRYTTTPVPYEVSMLQIPLYRFLRTAYCSWTPASSMPFRAVSTIYFNYISPWLRSPEAKATKKPSPISLSYISMNCSFYTVVFTDFIDFVARSELLPNYYDLLVIEKLLSVFGNQEVLKWVVAMDKFYIQDRQGFQNGDIKYPHSTFIREHMNALELMNYTSVFSQQTLENAKSIIASCKNISSITNQKITAEIASAANRIIHLLSKIFNINTDQVASLRRTLQDNDLIEEMEQRLTPEIQHHRLSPQGKDQVVRGLRKCDRRDIHYIGDPMYETMRSTEIPWLTQILVFISERLNEYYDLPRDKEVVERISEGEEVPVTKETFRFNLRILGDIRIHIWFVVIMSVVYLFLSLLQALFFGK